MLTNWNRQDTQATESFCRLHAAGTGESLNSSRISLYINNECPYLGYQLARIDIQPQVLTLGSNRLSISARSVSYVLLGGKEVEFNIVPIHQKTTWEQHNIYEINALLEFHVTKKNFLSYMAFFGEVVWNPHFYFFSTINQLKELTSSLSDAEQQRVITGTLAVVPKGPEGDLSIIPQIETYPMVGSSFTFEIPCFFKGQLFLSKVRISHDGMPTMIQERPLQVEGVFDEEENLQYYPLDASPILSGKLQAIAAKLTKGQRTAMATLRIDTFLQIWILPLFLFQVFLLFDLGMDNQRVFDYFELLKKSSVLSYACLTLGIVGVTIAIFRYAFLEIIVFLSKKTSNIWTFTALQLENEVRTNVARQGLIKTMCLSALEHMSKAIMSLALLLYGLSSFAFLSLPHLNFGQAITMTASNVPLVGTLIEEYVKGTPFVLPKLEGFPETIVAGMVGFIFTTVVIGVLTRIYFFSRERD